MLRRGSPDFLTAIARDLYTAVLSDVLDELGIRDQAMPPRSVRSTTDSRWWASRARASTARSPRSAAGRESVRARDRAGRRPEGRATSSCSAAAARRASRRGASSCRRPRGARRRGLRDRRVRPRHPAIRTVGFPVFHGGIAPLDSKGRGKVADIDVADRVRAASRSRRAISSSATRTASSSCRRRSRPMHSTARSRRCAARTGRARNWRRVPGWPTCSRGMASCEPAGPSQGRTPECEARRSLQARRAGRRANTGVRSTKVFKPAGPAEGQHRSAKHEGPPSSPPGRPKGEHRSTKGIR